MSSAGGFAARAPAAAPRALAGIGSRARLVLSAAAVLAATVLGVVSLRAAPALVGDIATRPSLATARLATATCADWQAAGNGRRGAIADALAVAATAPDPENPGATLSRASASTLLSRACSTRLSRSFLLFEIYNRGAAFGPPGAASSPALGGFGNGPHS